MTHLEFTCSDEKATALIRASRLYDEGIEPAEWISVKERLPKDGELVLFIPESNWKGVYIGKLNHIGARGAVSFEARDSRYRKQYYAKWWMPLPKNPEWEESAK